MADVQLRSLKIKTNALKRMSREKFAREIEIDKQRALVQKYKVEGRDDHDIRKQEEVLLECLKMVPKCQQDMAKAYDELNNIVMKMGQDLKTTGEYVTADMILQIVKPELPSVAELHQV